MKTTDPLDPAIVALFSLLDLTCLGEDSSEQDIARLCQKAVSGPVPAAAVCVRPEWVSLAVRLLQKSPVKVATVANFPDGTLPTETVCADIDRCIREGADEIDVVFPRAWFFAEEEKSVRDFLFGCRQACLDRTLKVILETGAFTDPKQLASACQIAGLCGADFLKTSTGNHPVGATLAAASVLLTVIKQSYPEKGIKLSGGIRTLDHAQSYIQLARTVMGSAWVSPAHFRIGTSQLTH